MITLQECFDFAGVSEDEIRSIAKRRGVPEIIAVAWRASEMPDETNSPRTSRRWEAQKQMRQRGGR